MNSTLPLFEILYFSQFYDDNGSIEEEIQTIMTRDLSLVHHYKKFLKGMSLGGGDYVRTISVKEVAQ